MRYPSKRGLKGLKSLNKRIAWLVEDIVHRNKLTNSKLAAILGVGKRSITNYRNMNMTPDMMLVKTLGERFGVNVVWIHTGKGEPYTDFHVPEQASGEGKMGRKGNKGASPRSIAASPRTAKPVDASAADADTRKEVETGRDR